MKIIVNEGKLMPFYCQKFIENVNMEIIYTVSTKIRVSD